MLTNHIVAYRRQVGLSLPMSISHYFVYLETICTLMDWMLHDLSSLKELKAACSCLVAHTLTESSGQKLTQRIRLKLSGFLQLKVH